MAKIRVLEIVHGLAIEGPLGGIERFGIELARALSRTPIEPVLCGLWRYHTPYEEQRIAQLRAEGIHVFFAADWDEFHPYRGFLKAWRGTIDNLAGQQVHLIHSHCQFGDGIALVVARPLHARAILRTVHNEREWPKRPGRRLLLTNFLYPLLFRQEIGISQAVTQNLDRRWLARLLGRKSVCLYNAIDLERFSTPVSQDTQREKRRDLDVPPGALLIGTIGRLTLQKGYAILLQAAAQVVARIPSAHFLIIGEGELESELEGLAKELGLARVVHFAGPRGDIEELLAIMDLFVSSSLWEGLPTVLLESMAARRPIVATDVSGTRELVQENVTGYLVPPGDPDALAEAILRALEERQRTAVMVASAYRRVQDFSINRVAEQHVELYSRLLAPITQKE